MKLRLNARQHRKGNLVLGQLEPELEERSGNNKVGLVHIQGPVKVPRK